MVVGITILVLLLAGVSNAITVTANGVTIHGFIAKTEDISYNGIKVASNNNLIKNNNLSSNLYGIWECSK